MERYGPSVLMEPPRSGLSVLVWVLPPVGVAVALAAVVLAVKAMSRPRGPEPSRQVAAAELSEEELAAYSGRIDRALGLGRDVGEVGGGSGSQRKEAG